MTKVMGVCQDLILKDMKKYSTINVTIDEAIEWYNSGNETLKELALKAFDRKDLVYYFKSIKTFKNACETLGLNYDTMLVKAKEISFVSKASAAMFKLNIVRKALNLGQDLHFVKDPENSEIFFPYVPFVIEDSTYYDDELKSGIMEIIGKIKVEGEEYNILGGKTSTIEYFGLGNFFCYGNVGKADANFSFLGCASKEIAKHLGKYFGMLITEAKYGDLDGFEIIEDLTKGY